MASHLQGLSQGHRGKYEWYVKSCVKQDAGLPEEGSEWLLRSTEMR